MDKDGRRNIENGQNELTVEMVPDGVLLLFYFYTQTHTYEGSYVSKNPSAESVSYQQEHKRVVQQLNGPELQFHVID